jgi:hypothetical protein
MRDAKYGLLVAILLLGVCACRDAGQSPAVDQGTGDSAARKQADDGGFGVDVSVGDEGAKIEAGEADPQSGVDVDVEPGDGVDVEVDIGGGTSKKSEPKKESGT